MITISACMIVKNEEAVLRRCLDSLKGIYDELIIVDTGSTDSTVKIASEYTDRIYSFEWTGSFSDARNFSLSKATMDYIYVPDADEVLDEENRQRFLRLKTCLLPEIEIVQMRYVNQLSLGTVYNFDEEYRPKLYKRLRNFTFIEPVHEMVRLDPVVFDSDIDIIHRPESLHARRDIDIFARITKDCTRISDRLSLMYARELLINGEPEDFCRASDYFNMLSECDNMELVKASNIVLAKANFHTKSLGELMKHALKDAATGYSSEMCTILGAYYEECEDFSESAIWYYNARFETEPELCLSYKEKLPLEGLVRVYKALNEPDIAAQYEAELNK